MEREVREHSMADKEKIIKNVKRGGTVMVYVGTANLVRPFVNKAREDQNGAMQACTIFGGTVLSLGIAKIANKWMNTMVDKVVDFIEDVKPKKNKKEPEGEQDKEGH